MTLALRSYQREAIDDTRKRWNAGAVRVPLVLATGLGKSVIAASLISEWMRDNPGKRALVIAHTDELIDQLYRKVLDVAPHLRAGIVKGTKNQLLADVIVSSRQTLAYARRRVGIRDVGLIIIDECFPAGTRVGGKRIEDLRPGDTVPSWDEASGRVVQRPVVAAMRKRPAAMVRVVMDGETFECTPNHPILTTRGWCPAGMLLSGEYVVSFTHDEQASKDAGGRQGRCGSGEGRGEQACAPDAAVHRVWQPCGHAERATPQVRDVAQGWQGVRYGRVPQGVGEPRVVGANVKDESRSCVCADDGAQPDGSFGCSGEDERNSQADQAQAAREGREREACNGSAANPGGIPRMAHGGDCSSRRRGAPLSLQVGYRAPDNEGVRGGGRGVPFLAGAPRCRRSAGRSPVASRVVDVQVLEPGSDGTYGGVCSDGFVYNVEVAGTHTYLIGDGVVAHNCHHSTAQNSYGDILRHFGAFDTDGAVKVAGFTATLVRGDKQKLSSVWEECTFARDIRFGIRNGYLLDVQGARIVVPGMNAGGVAMRGGDYDAAALAEELDRTFAIETIAKQYAEIASDRKTIAFWPLVATAEHAAEVFNDHGIRSGWVSGAMDKTLRRQTLADLRSGKLTCVHNAMVLTEGFDDPSVDCVLVCRRTVSPVMGPQMAGRGMRPPLWIPPAQRRPMLLIDAVGAFDAGTLQLMIDLSPERARIAERLDLDTETLTLEERESAIDAALAAEMDEQRAGASYEFEADEYRGATEVVAFDPLGRDAVWAVTPAGTHYVKAGGDAYVFVVPSLGGDPGTFDVVACSKRDSARVQGWQRGTAHAGLSFELALGWAESEALEIGGYGAKTLGARKSKWRRGLVSEAAERTARSLGAWRDGMSAGECSDAIDAVYAARRIDPLVARVMSRV